MYTISFGLRTQLGSLVHYAKEIEFRAYLNDGQPVSKPHPQI